MSGLITPDLEKSETNQTGVFLDCVNKVLNYMGISEASDFSRHAIDKHHEDFDSPKITPPSSRPSFDHLCPERLRSLIPPSNFGAVVPGSIYRSSFPTLENEEFLKSLHLTTILTLVTTPYPEEMTQFVKSNNIRHIILPLPANKGEISLDESTIHEVMKIVLDRSQHPLLIHCNKGKHRTGCVVGCFRKCQGENIPSILEEYHTYADPKARLYDETCIELYDEHSILWVATAHCWRTGTPIVSSSAASHPLALTSHPPPPATVIKSR